SGWRSTISRDASVRRLDPAVQSRTKDRCTCPRAQKASRRRLNPWNSIHQPISDLRSQYSWPFSCCCRPSALVGQNELIRDSPDDSQTGINVRVFPAFLQDRREVLTLPAPRVTRTLGRGSDLAIFPGIWTHSFCRLLLNA